MNVPNALVVSIPMYLVNEMGHYWNMENMLPTEMNLVDLYQSNYRNMYKTLKKSTTYSDIGSNLLGDAATTHSADEIRFHEQSVRQILFHTVFEGYN